MPEIAIRVFQDGVNLVGVIFPRNDGDAILEHRQSLSSLGLSAAESVLSHETAYETYKARSHSRAARNGFEIEIEYEGERLSITPYNHTGPLDEQVVLYRFDDLNIKDDRQTPIQQAKSKAKIRASEDKEVSNEEWSGEELH